MPFWIFLSKYVLYLPSFEIMHFIIFSHFAGISSLMLYSYTELCRKNLKKSKIHVMYLVVLGMKVSSAILILLQILLKYKRFTKAFRQLHVVDIQIKKLGTTLPSYKYYYLYFFAFHTCYPFVRVGCMILQHQSGLQLGTMFSEYLSRGIQHDINIMVTNYFLFYVTAVYQKFYFINQQIASLNDAKISSNKKRSMMLLRTVTKMHEDLCKGAKYINEVLEIPMFCIIVWQMVEFIFLVYMMYHGEKTGILVNSVSYLLQMMNMLAPTRLAKMEVRVD